jgi:hypothetical protein
MVHLGYYSGPTQFKFRTVWLSALTVSPSVLTWQKNQFLPKDGEIGPGMTEIQARHEPGPGQAGNTCDTAGYAA